MESPGLPHTLGPMDAFWGPDSVSAPVLAHVAPATPPTFLPQPVSASARSFALAAPRQHPVLFSCFISLSLRTLPAPLHSLSLPTAGELRQCGPCSLCSCSTYRGPGAPQGLSVGSRKDGSLGTCGSFPYPRILLSRGAASSTRGSDRGGGVGRGDPEGGATSGQEGEPQGDDPGAQRRGQCGCWWSWGVGTETATLGEVGPQEGLWWPGQEQGSHQMVQLRPLLRLCVLQGSICWGRTGREALLGRTP